jgi:energy-coupling factor transporter transmembrane protein EcfT
MAMILDALPVNPSYMTRWDPRWKIAAFSITAAIVAFCHSDVSLLSAWLGLSLVLAASRLDWVFVFRRSVYFVAYLTPFVALTLISSVAGTEKLPFRFVLRAIDIVYAGSVVCRHHTLRRCYQGARVSRSTAVLDPPFSHVPPIYLPDR